MKKVFKKLLLFLPILAIIISVNFYLDPAHLFDGGSYEKGLANFLLEGKNVATSPNFDLYILQNYYIQGLNSPRDIIVLGSSRSLSIRSNLFPSKTFFNNSINSARIEDYEYIYGLYKAKALVPKTVIIGVDPWILYRNKSNLNNENASSIIIRISGQVITFIDKRIGTEVSSERISKYYQLISPGYFQSSFGLFIKRLQKKDQNYNYYSIDDVNDPKIVIFADGARNLKKAPLDDVRKSALTYDPIPLFGGFESLDEGLISRFERFVDLLQSDGTRVVLFLPPFHPIVYSNLVNSKYKVIIEAQRYFKDLSKEKNIQILGSYNPNDYQLEELDFSDGTHVLESGVEKIFKLADFNAK